MAKMWRRGIEKDVTPVMATVVVLCVSVYGLESRDKKLDSMQDSWHVESNVGMDTQKDPRI